MTRRAFIQALAAVACVLSEAVRSPVRVEVVQDAEDGVPRVRWVPAGSWMTEEDRMWADATSKRG